MAKEHVDLLLQALECEYHSKYICDRVRFGVYSGNGVADEVVTLIQKWLENNGGYDEDDEYVKYSFDYTDLYDQGMTREEWVKTILIPLAEKL